MDDTIAIIVAGEIRTLQTTHKTWPTQITNGCLSVYTWDHCTETNRHVGRSMIKKLISTRQIRILPRYTNLEDWKTWSVCRQIFLWQMAVQDLPDSAEVVVVMRPDCAFSPYPVDWDFLLSVARQEGWKIFTAFQSQYNPFADVCFWGHRNAISKFVLGLSIDEFLAQPTAEVHQWFYDRATTHGLTVDTRTDIRSLIIRPAAAHCDVTTEQGWSDASDIGIIDIEGRLRRRNQIT